MSDWPKYNPERHRRLSNGEFICDDSDADVERYWGCLEDCRPGDPCRCCEKARADAAEAAIERVRAVRWHFDSTTRPVFFVDDIRAALDGAP